MNLKIVCHKTKKSTKTPRPVTLILIPRNNWHHYAFHFIVKEQPYQILSLVIRLTPVRMLLTEETRLPFVHSKGPPVVPACFVLIYTYKVFLYSLIKVIISYSDISNHGTIMLPVQFMLNDYTRCYFITGLTFLFWCKILIWSSSIYVLTILFIVKLKFLMV